MRRYNICIHNNRGDISFDENFKAKNANEALEKLLEVEDVKIGGIIRIGR